MPLTLTETTYTSLSKPDTVTQSVRSGASWVVQGKTEYEYDEYSLTSRSGTIPDRDTPASVRGNLTTIRHFTDATHSVEEHFYYDTLGNMVKHVDPRSKETKFDYADNYTDSDRNTFAFPKSVENALTQKVYVKYDYSTGLPVETTDLRGGTAATAYDDMGRPTGITTSAGGQVDYTYSYGTGYESVVQASLVASGKTITTTTTTDGLGRPVSAVLSEPDSIMTTVATQYDDNGRAYRVSQPYRSGTPDYTETTFDVLGRPVTVTNPGGTSVSFAYTANTVTATDEAGVQKKQTFDGVGRLTAVAVPDPSETSPSLSDPLTTLYAYGPATVSGYSGLSQFTVTQHVESTTAQSRTFVSDWAGRLQYESHPETAVNTYTYDNAGNVLTRTDARGANCRATYTYDDLGRPLTTSYASGSSPCVDPTPAVTTTYDSATGLTSYIGFPIMVQVGDSSHHDDTIYTYSAAGQVASENRTFDGVTGTFSSSYTYDLGGRMLTATYPSGRVVTYSYQSSSGTASNRINTIVDTTTSKTLVSSVVDNASGLITSRTLGTTTATKVDQAYNGRNQLTDIVATQNTGATTLLDLEYAYGGTSGSSANVGRIRTRTDAVEPEQSVDYTYDAMYRLKKVRRANTSTPDWSIAWTFDEWGNRTAQTPDGLDSVVGSQSRAYSANRVTGDSAVTYDSAGNLTADGSSLTYQWDAESRLKSVNSGSITYGYDGEGRRVKKTSGGVTTYYMYGITGLQSEFSTVSGATAAASTDRLTFRVPEHNGTGVLLLDAAGNLVENNRVLPYGEPFRAVSGSTNDDKFTSYNRDSDTGLDYAMARHYASTQGAFLSPDPGHVGANPNDPTTWNAYLYTSADPINFVDPSGLCYFNDKLDLIGSSEDGRAWLVLDSKDADRISKSEAAISSTEFMGLWRLPDTDVILAMDHAVRASRIPDRMPGNVTGFHEEGGLWGLDRDGNPFAAGAVPGAPGRPGTDLKINEFNPMDSTVIPPGSVIRGGYHVHPRGTEASTSTDPGRIGSGSTKGFGQPVSGDDWASRDPGSLSFVLADGTDEVFLYTKNDRHKVLAKGNLQKFLELGYLAGICDAPRRR